ncbi:6-bladed beta-propeller [Spirosoma linguale]|uniref:6-bladed beta-propeller protein n=1 Tax=Spirosoma linguale (strain ATCC 33905 / DSM 74 / LMG 10896 / Claus 1) TaxID=504472 RepID=D2QMK9_SPILD|nr:hypothetical protein Slin_4441 [Spirosoma linguale DSM 74]
MSKIAYAIKLITLLCIVINLLSCKEKPGTGNEESYQVSNPSSISKKDNITSIDVDLSKESPANYSDLFSSIEYKILKSPATILVGKIDKIVEAEDRFFLKSNGKIYIFSEEGNYLSKIDQKGEGPNQYKSITDFLVDTVTHHIEILDNHSFSVFEFDYKGTYIKNWQHGVLSFQFHKLSTDNYIFYVDKELASSYEGRFLLYNKKKNKITDNFVPMDKRRIKYEAFMDVNNFCAHPNKTLLSCSGNDTIFSYKPGTIKPKYIFKFNENTVPKDFYDKKFESIVEFNEKRLKNEFIGLYYVDFLENDNYLISQIVKGKTVYYLWFDKKKKEYRIINRFNDDMTFLKGRIHVAETFPTYFGPKRALRSLEPEAILAPLDSIQATNSDEELKLLFSKVPQLKTLRESIKLNSNPVIQIMTYKQG